ncbi:MAG: 23S rRNA (uracil(1939)-C(5))-methyltransferase RlmD [Candidatus Eremiobacteraeota bacterium]|nr:23S rRNA (uracil(1939)-C(5))-methyltransferase RlmD [Candidatus Eremiobacteraeota bacterium]
MLSNGQGVGRLDGLVVFCFGPLPGERARVRISEVKPRYAVARLLRLIAESPDRAVAFCPVFGSCGGCQLQHLNYPAQLAWKRNVVRQALARIGSADDVEVAPAIGMAEPRAYRNKMALVVDRATKPPALGFYRQRSHAVVAIDRCPVVAPGLDDLLQRLDRARGTPAVEAMLSESRHLVARSSAAGGEIVLTITSDRRSGAASAAAAQLLRDVPGLRGVENSFELPGANAILGRKRQRLAGSVEIDEVIAGIRYRIAAGSFFQINTEIVSRIFEILGPRLARPARVVDLYCGVGTFSLFFARHGWSVVGIEEDSRAVAQARANARLNGLERYVRFETGRVEHAVASARVAPALRDASVVFLDPPRKGSDEATLGAIAHAKPQIWYLSCDAATLARDSKFLVAKGYRITAVQPFDMFPQTGHVESLAFFEPTSA